MPYCDDDGAATSVVSVVVLLVVVVVVVVVVMGVELVGVFDSVVAAALLSAETAFKGKC